MQTNKNTSTRLYIVILLLLSIVTIFPLLKSGYYYSHDGIVHAARFAKFHQSLMDGQMPPRWANGIAFGLGSPAIMFYGFLPYLLAEIPYFFTHSYTNSLETIFGLSLILSGLSFYLFAKKISKNDATSLLGSLLYVWAPYRMVDVYVRGAYPESFIFIFPPILFWSAYLITGRNKYFGVIVAGVSIAAMILSHTVLAMAFIGLFALYTIYINQKNLDCKILVSLFFSILIGLSLSAFYLLPSLTESAQIHSEILTKLAIYKTNYIPFLRLLYTRWGWGIVDSNNSLATHIGLPQLAVFLFVIVQIMRKKLVVNKGITYFFLFSTLGVLFLTNVNSSLFWDHIPLLQLFIYPWRFLAVSTFTLATLSTLILTGFKHYKVFVFGLIVFMIISGRNSLQFASFYSASNQIYEEFKGTTDIAGEFLPKSANLEEIKLCYINNCNFPKIDGLNKGEYFLITEKSNELDFVTNTNNDNEIILGILDFPGWKISIDKNPVTKNASSDGRMSLYLPTGNHLVEASFSETPIWKLGDFVSITTFVALLLLTIHEISKRSKNYLL